MIVLQSHVQIVYTTSRGHDIYVDSSTICEPELSVMLFYMPFQPSLFIRSETVGYDCLT